jgi:PAS domain-containing protein
MMTYVMLAIISEMFFTLYLNVFGIYNMIGHILYALSFYFMYKAVSWTSLQNPFNFLFYKLSQKNFKLKLKAQELEKANEKMGIEIRGRKDIEDKLIKSEKTYKTFIETLPDAIFVHVDG